MDLEHRCLDCDRNNWKIAARTGQPLIYKCFAGMMDGCMPVTVEGRCIGFMMLGQFRTSARCGSEVNRTWHERFGNDDLAKAFLAAPCFKPGKVKDILAMLSALTEFIINRHLIQLHGPTPFHIVLVNVDSGKETDLTEPLFPERSQTAEGVAAWSSDGQWLVFRHIAVPKEGPQGVGIYMIKPNGSGRKRIPIAASKD